MGKGEGERRAGGKDQGAKGRGALYGRRKKWRDKGEKNGTTNCGEGWKGRGAGGREEPEKPSRKARAGGREKKTEREKYGGSTGKEDKYRGRRVRRQAGVSGTTGRRRGRPRRHGKE